MILVVTTNGQDEDLHPFNDIDEARKFARSMFANLTYSELKTHKVEVWHCIDDNPEESGNFDHDLDEDFESWKLSVWGLNPSN